MARVKETELLKKLRGFSWPKKLGMTKKDGSHGWEPETVKGWFESWEKAFIQKGHITNRSLGRKGSIRSILPEESAITCLTESSNGSIYGGTCGKKGHLFVYWNKPIADWITDIGTVIERGAITGLCASADGKNIYGSYVSLDSSGKGGLFAHNTEFDMADEFGHLVSPVEQLPMGCEKEGVLNIVLETGGNILWGITDKKQKVFRYSIKDKKFIELTRITPEIISQTFSLWKDTYLIVGGKDKSLIQINVNTGKTKCIKVSLEPKTIAKDLFNETYWLGTEEGYLAAIEPDALEVKFQTSNGINKRISALTLWQGRKLFGIAGDEKDISELFIYDIHKDRFEILGKLYATIERPWHAYHIRSLVAGNDGRIYCGEYDRISHLFVYFPPAELY